MSDSPKKRLLVMNGQRLVQQKVDEEWNTQKVDKAGALKPGIYDLYLSKAVDKSKSLNGTVLYADKTSVYQKVGQDYIAHSRKDLANVPEPGVNVRISYDGDRAVVTTLSPKLVQGRSR